MKKNTKNLGVMNGLIWVLGLSLSLSTWAGQKRYIVTFKGAQQYQAANIQWQNSKALEALGLRAGGKGTKVNLFNTAAQVVKPLDHVQMMIVAIDKPDVAAQLAKNPAVESVEEEIFYKAPAPVNGYLAARDRMSQSTGVCPSEIPWGISAVKAEQAWNQTKGRSARVLILDTGIDKEHPAVKSRFEKGRNFTTTEMDMSVTAKTSMSDDDVTDNVGHGTHVAGTIAADGTCLYGVAPEARVLSGKVCEESGCSSAALVAGIDWGIAEGVDVISMSLGGAFATPSQQRAIERAESANVVVVAATGNDGKRMISYPAAFESVIAVGAVDSTLKRAEFSNYGPGLDVVAPGVDVVSSVPRGKGRISSVTLDMGDGKSTQVKSVSFAGAPENSSPVNGQLVYVGLGKPEDIAKADLRGKFALIERGEIPFKDKALNAQSAGATGVVIFNNASGLARGSVGDDGAVRIPAAMIEQAIGQQIMGHLQQGQRVSAGVATLQSDYDSFDGTSMATPHVSGVVALIRSMNHQLSPEQVRNILSRTANNAGNADEYGAGVVNATQAIGQSQRLQLGADL